MTRDRARRGDPRRNASFRDRPRTSRHRGSCSAARSGIPSQTAFSHRHREQAKARRAQKGRELRRGRCGNGETSARTSRRATNEIGAAPFARGLALQGLYRVAARGATTRQTCNPSSRSQGFGKATPNISRGSSGHNRGRRGARAPDRARARSQAQRASPVERGILLLAAFELKNATVYPLQGGDQRGDRARQGLRRHRRPQVRERRARQARPRTEAAREKA